MQSEQIETFHLACKKEGFEDQAISLLIEIGIKSNFKLNSMGIPELQKMRSSLPAEEYSRFCSKLGSWKSDYVPSEVESWCKQIGIDRRPEIVEKLLCDYSFARVLDIYFYFEKGESSTEFLEIIKSCKMNFTEKNRFIAALKSFIPPQVTFF